MNTTTDDSLLRRTLQEIYADYPQSSRNDWEREVMREIGVVAAPREEKQSGKRAYIGWWAGAAAVAAVGLLLLAVTFWPQSRPTAKPQPAVVQTSVKKQSLALPLEEKVTDIHPVSTDQQSKLVASTEADARTVSAPQRLAKVMSSSEPQVAPETVDKTETEALSPYERPRILREPRSAKRRLLIVTEEVPRQINGFSLEAYDRLIGMEVKTPKPDKNWHLEEYRIKY